MEDTDQCKIRVSANSKGVVNMIGLGLWLDEPPTKHQKEGMKILFFRLSIFENFQPIKPNFHASTLIDNNYPQPTLAKGLFVSCDRIPKIIFQ